MNSDVKYVITACEYRIALFKLSLMIRLCDWQRKFHAMQT